MSQTIAQNAIAGIVQGVGPTMGALNSVVAEIATTDIPVLLVGESGTGKEVYARLIHRLSTGSSGPLKKVNCVALNSDSFREQIWDEVQASTAQDKSGYGTLFLDEVAELDLQCQRTLLSILPDGEPKDDVPRLTERLICATTRDLEQAIDAGRFRRELYFRINGVSLRLPALRERKEDIPALLDCLVGKHAVLLQKARPDINPDAMEFLLSYPWPGNIRELENVAKKMVVLGNARLALSDLHAPSPGVRQTVDGAQASSLKVAARAASRRTEQELILKALERTRWNRKRAAQELQISYKSLLYKLKQIGPPHPNSGNKA
jgi:two-component system, NtrC family, response regulator AtoC